MAHATLNNDRLASRKCDRLAADSPPPAKEAQRRMRHRRRRKNAQEFAERALGPRAPLGELKAAAVVRVRVPENLLAPRERRPPLRRAAGGAAQSAQHHQRCAQKPRDTTNSTRVQQSRALHRSTGDSHRHAPDVELYSAPERSTALQLYSALYTLPALYILYTLPHLTPNNLFTQRTQNLALPTLELSPHPKGTILKLGPSPVPPPPNKRRNYLCLS